MGIIETVRQNITGRIATEDSELELLIEMIKTFGGGDHLEIGVLHGGTVAIAGLALKEINTDAFVYCIDPMDGYYKDNELYGCAVDPITTVPITPHLFFDNMEKFDIDNVFLFQTKSVPFPIKDKGFDTAFIDGDHWGDTPYKDLMSAGWFTKKAMMVDNYDPEHPDVMSAVNDYILIGMWKIWKTSNHGVVLVRDK